MDTAQSAFIQFVANRGGIAVYGVPVSNVYIDVDGYPTQRFTKAILKYRSGKDPQNYDVESIRLI